MNAEDEKKNPREFRALCGLSVEEFDALLPLFCDEAWNYLSQFTWKGELRTNAYSARSNGSKLSNMQNLLFFVLYYMRREKEQLPLAKMFGVTRETANRRLGVAQPLLNEALRRWRPGREEAFFQMEGPENQTLAMDVTNREVPRPVKGESQTYNGGPKKTF